MTKGKILIVDDNLMNIELLVETLEPFDYEILTFTSPRKALIETKDIKIDLALVDIVMPELNGFEFVEEFSKIHIYTPIAYVSAYGKDENKIKGFNSGSYIFIEKPFEVKIIRAQIQSILKLKAMQDELLQEKQKLDNIFEYTSNEIILTDLNFSIISRNYKVLDKNFRDVNNFTEIIKLFSSDEKERFENFLKSKENHCQLKIMLDNKFVKISFSKIKPVGIHTGYIILLEDMTQEYEKDVMCNYFIEMLTHDLKTPIRAEKRVLKLLMDGSFGQLNNEQKEIVQNLLNSSLFMLRMTDNVLARYKFKSGDFKINKTPNILKKSIEDSVEYVKYMIEAKQQVINVCYNYTDDKNTMFVYDKRAINQILINILSNASEYSPSNTEIYLIVENENSNIKISIKDEGFGIPSNILNAINADKEPDAKRLKKVGANLGLFITKKIIEAHGGTIAITTNPIDGTVYSFSLPMKSYINETNFCF